MAIRYMYLKAIASYSWVFSSVSDSTCLSSKAMRYGIIESSAGRMRTLTTVVIFQNSRRIPMPWEKRIIQPRDVRTCAVWNMGDVLVLSLLSSRYKKITPCIKTFARMDRTEIPTLFFLLR